VPEPHVYALFLLRHHVPRQLVPRMKRLYRVCDALAGFD